MDLLHIVASTLAAGALTAAVALIAYSSRLKRDVESTRLRLAEAAEAVERLRGASALAESLRHQNSTLARRLEDAFHEDKQKVGWLDAQQEEMNWLRAELEKRPKVSRRIYKILTLGIKGTGKTSLTLKWANPLIDLGTLHGTKIERYERTVSHVALKDVITEHVFEVGDWGGEYIVDAQQELVMEEVNGLLIVVDLCGGDGKTLNQARISEQMEEFRPQALRYFFGPKTVASCKTVVLFINKSDVLSGTPGEVERKAREIYARLIADLESFSGSVSIQVFVGSASSGHSIHHLFAHFVERILPKNAYDGQLLQKMKEDVGSDGAEGTPRNGVPAAAGAFHGA